MVGGRAALAAERGALAIRFSESNRFEKTLEGSGLEHGDFGWAHCAGIILIWSMANHLASYEVRSRIVGLTYLYSTLAHHYRNSCLASRNPSYHRSSP